MMEGGEVLGRLLPALALVIATPLLVRHWLRKGRGLAVGELRVVARAPMGRTAAAVIVETSGRRFLLGVTESSVRLISELEAEGEEPAVAPGTDARSSEGDPGPWTGLDYWRRMTLRRSPKEPVRVIAE